MEVPACSLFLNADCGGFGRATLTPSSRPEHSRHAGGPSARSRSIPRFCKGCSPVCSPGFPLGEDRPGVVLAAGTLRAHRPPRGNCAIGGIGGQCHRSSVALLRAVGLEVLAYLSSSFAYLAGTARFDPPKSLIRAKFTPITFPFGLKSGPPEPPNVVAAS